MTLVKLDGTADLLVFLTDDDIATGVPGDCMRCAVAQGIRRMIGRPDTAVEIYPSCAYITMPVDARTLEDNIGFGTPNADTLKVGDMANIRFQVDRTCREQILIFDANATADAGGYRLRKVVPSQRLANRKRREGERNGSRPYLSRKRSPWLRARGPLSQPPR